MLVPENLGVFRLALVLVFVVFPVFAFVFRRKWRLEVARREEISRLLVLAAEESARAELEAQFDYFVAPPPEPEVPAPVAGTSQRICAVCYIPTPNRCAGCKSVHYCSGKCQIIHWRQGHKDECQTLRAGSEINDEASSFIGSDLKQPFPDDYVTHVENDGSPCDEQGITALEGLGFSSPFTTSDISMKDGVGAAKICLHEEEPGSMSVLRDNSSLYGVSTSIPGNGICIDDSSSDDDSVHDLNSESCDSSSTFESFETASSDSHVEQIKPLETKTCMKVDVDASASGGLKDEALSGKTSSLGSRVSHPDNNSVKPSICTSGFWEGTLPTNKTRKHVPNNNVKPKSTGASNENLPDLKSTTQFSAALSGHPSSDETVSNNHASARTSKLIAVTTSSSKESAAHIRHPSSMLSSFKEHDTRIKEVDVNRIKPGKVGVASDTSEDISLPSSLSRAHHLERYNQDTQKSLLSSKVSLSLQSNGISSSGLKEDTAVAAKSIKASGNAAMPPQVAMLIPSGPVGLKSSMLKVLEQLRTPRSSKQVDGAGRNGEKAVFAYDLFVKLYHWNKVELRPCGLINCGNSCYANVVLQCLAFTPPLTAYLLQGLHSKTCVKKGWCLTCEFERLVLKANKVGHPQSPIGILSQIQKIGSHLTNGREEDAHEFLRYSIETMQSICLQEAEVKAFSSLKEETTLMGLTFGGYLRSKIKCTRCHGKSERQERIMDLTVEIGGDVETLEDALRQFTGTENLDGENKYYCGRCNSYERAKKKLSILEAPNVLTIALKRYQSGKFGKLNKSIRFPEILNLAPYMRGGGDKAPIYRLYGVVVHLDIMNASFSGHYVCYVRNAQNKWFKIDDSTVTAVELDGVLNKGAYMLFYSRCSPRAPRSIRSTLVSRDVPIKIKNPVVDPSHSNVRISISRQREFSAHLTHIPDDMRNLSYIHQDETSLPPPHNNSGDSSSDSSTIFTHSDGVSTTTDSTRDSFSADDFSEYIFGYNAFSRSSDLDTSSSSSSSSSSPLYSNHSPLSDSERHTSALPDWNVHQTCSLVDTRNRVQ